MKLICQKEHRQVLEQYFAPYQELEIVLVEQGIDYVGLHYCFNYEDLTKVKADLESMIGKFLLGMIDQKIYRINYREIVYIEGFSKEAYLYTENLQYWCRDKLFVLEKRLNNYGFIRISKSIIVNINEIEYMLPETNSRYSLHMKNGVVLILTRNYLAAFKNRLEMR